MIFTRTAIAIIVTSSTMKTMDEVGRDTTMSRDIIRVSHKATIAYDNYFNDKDDT